MKNLKINPNPANVKHTIDLIQASAMLAMEQTEIHAAVLSGKRAEKPEAIYRYLRANFKYKEDPFGKEYIRMPELSWQDRKEGIDCEDFSIMAAALCIHADLVPVYRVIDYGNGPAHIYVVARDRNRSYIIDPTNPKFNSEYPHRKHWDHMILKSTYDMQKGLGTALADQIRLVQLQLYIARKELQIEGDHHGWFGRRTEADKKRVANVEKFEARLKELKNQYYSSKGMGYTPYTMTATELERQISMLQTLLKQKTYGTPEYRRISQKLSGYRTELKMRRDNNLGDTVPDTATMLRMQGLRGANPTKWIDLMIDAEIQKERIQQLKLKYQ